MRLPSWLAVEDMGREGDRMVVRFRVRWWHPGLWLALLRRRP